MRFVAKTAAVFFVSGIAVGGCLNPREPTPNICFGTCPRIPDLEPLGKLCTLDRQSCQGGILTATTSASTWTVIAKDSASANAHFSTRQQCLVVNRLFR